MGILGWYGADGKECGFYIVSDGRIAFKFNDSVSVSGGLIPLDTDTWVEVGFDGTTMRAFVNGQSVATTTPGANILTQPNEGPRIGRIGIGGSWYSMTGRISNLEFYKDRCLHTENFTPPA